MLPAAPASRQSPLPLGVPGCDRTALAQPRFSSFDRPNERSDNFVQVLSTDGVRHGGAPSAHDGGVRVSGPAGVAAREPTSTVTAVW